MSDLSDQGKRKKCSIFNCVNGVIPFFIWQNTVKFASADNLQPATVTRTIGL